MDGVGSEHSSHLVPIPVRAEPVDPKGGRSPTAAFLFGARKKGQGFDKLSPNGFLFAETGFYARKWLRAR